MNGKDFFKKRYSDMRGDLKFIKLRRCIRTNTKKISSNNLKKRLEKRGVKLQKISFLKNGFYVNNSKFNLVSTPEYLLGLFYIQDAATQTSAEILNPKNLTLDGFAAPGGKTTHLSTYVDVIAIENNKKRFKKLKYNLERLGIENCIAYNMDFLDVTKNFDYILLDVPCSGNYMLEKDWIFNNNLKRITERSKIQKKFLSHALSILNKNGELVYCTCSLEPEEDEFVIQYALDNFNVKLEKIETIGDNGLTEIFGRRLDSNMKYCKRFWPYKTETIGFFIARLRKC